MCAQVLATQTLFPAESTPTQDNSAFGDPGSNSIIRKTLKQLPIKWSRDNIAIGKDTYPSKQHLPILSCPNPLAKSTRHYVVLNSGHTFHEKEFASFNYLLFPRLGDWAIIRALPGAAQWQPGEPFPEEIIKAGLFDENWKLP